MKQSNRVQRGPVFVEPSGPSPLEKANRVLRVLAITVAAAAILVGLSGCSAAAAAGVPEEFRDELAQKRAVYQLKGRDPVFDPTGYELVDPARIFAHCYPEKVRSVGRWAILDAAREEYGLDWDVVVYELHSEGVTFNGQEYELKVFLSGHVYRRLDPPPE